MKRTPTAERLKKTRQRLQKKLEDERLAGSLPTWSMNPRFISAVTLFTQQIGHPADTFGDQWEDYFLPWGVFIEAWQDPELRQDFEKHRQEDAERYGKTEAGPSWSFGEMVAREHRDGVQG